MTRCCTLLLLLLLAACAAPGTRQAGTETTLLRQQLAALPGVTVSAAEPLAFGYPGTALFASGAVLPLPGGTALLDPLADFLLRHPDLSWQVSLQAATEHGSDYDQLLAEKRSELLASYLRSKGVAPGALDFFPQAAERQQLLFTLKPPPAAGNE